MRHDRKFMPFWEGSTMPRLIATAIIAVILSASLPVLAQDPAQPAAPRPGTEAVKEPVKSASPAAVDAEVAKWRNYADLVTKQNEELRARLDGIEAPLWERYLKAKISEYDFKVEMLEVNKRAFAHQYFASYVILALVVAVVLGGLYFAHVQLMAGLRPLLEAPGAESGAVAQGAGTAGPPGDPKARGAGAVPIDATTLSAEIGKVTVTSSIVGVVVLVISLAFLFIYTQQIYTIRITDPYRPTVGEPGKPETKSDTASSPQTAK
ncbi:MAG: hypothetical protein HZA66_02295 [Rhodopseudomonas palustris]|uniref:Uncharacterized protein n=1 Tax=Rhodopseudomonas palustris TaxID=1076 RepID=A0A933RU08_RHOPL|nr:hypothetical protein [Rhodopseudomonas palustris]